MDMCNQEGVLLYENKKGYDGKYATDKNEIRGNKYEIFISSQPLDAPSSHRSSTTIAMVAAHSQTQY
jgi:hypothetical protein